MTVSVSYVSQLTISETLTGAFISAADATVTINGMNMSITVDATTTVPATKGTAFAVTLSSGAATINLAALPGLTSEETIVGTGLKVQGVKFANPSTNANAITITEGASNGHATLGASFSITLQPGQEIMAWLNDTGQDVASGDRTIDLAGTLSQVLNVEFVLG